MSSEGRACVLGTAIRVRPLGARWARGAGAEGRLTASPSARGGLWRSFCRNTACDTAGTPDPSQCAQRRPLAPTQGPRPGLARVFPEPCCGPGLFLPNAAPCPPFTGDSLTPPCPPGDAPPPNLSQTLPFRSLWHGLRGVCVSEEPAGHHPATLGLPPLLGRTALGPLVVFE